jgi:outer membrane protein TolC
MLPVLPRRLLATSLPILSAFALSTAHGQETRKLTLDRAIALAQQDGAEARAATAQLGQARMAARVVAARVMPQVGLTTQLVNFDHGINQITLPDGSVQFVGQSNNRTNVGLDVSQALPMTGGTISLSTQLSRADQFGNFTSQSWAATPVLLGLNQPLFQLHTLEWDRRESDAAVEVAERQFAESRGTIARNVATQYMALRRAELALDNAKANALIGDSVLMLNQARYKYGAVSILEVGRSELNTPPARLAAAAAELTRDRAVAALALMVGLPEGTSITTEEPALPDTAALVTDAVIDAAAQHSLAAVRFRADSISAERRFAVARAGSRPSASLVGSIGFNQTGNTLPLAYDSPLGKQRATVGLTLPLLRWGAGDAQVDAARYEMQSSLAIARRDMDQVKQDVRFAARAVAVSTEQLRLATIADSIASVQFRVARLQYASGSLSYTDFLNVQHDKDNAVLGRVDAMAKFWQQYYDYKRLVNPDPAG